MAAPLCFFGCGSSTPSAGATGGTSGSRDAASSSGGGTSGSNGGTSGSGGGASGSRDAASNSGGGASGSGGSTGSTSCTLQTTNVTAATYPSGLTLTKACSPYLVDQITVRDGGVLTIEAGATVKFSFNTAIYVGQSGSGKLVAKGTAQSPITLTSQTGLTTDEGWYGLEFFAGTASGSQVSYTTIEFAGGNFDAAIVGEAGMPKNVVTLDHVAINNSNSGGIQVVDSTSAFIVTNCTMDGAPYTP